jgi:hypothetical protein
MIDFFIFLFYSQFRNVFSLPTDFEPITLKITDLEKRLKEMESMSRLLKKQVLKINKGVDDLLGFKKAFENSQSIN